MSLTQQTRQISHPPQTSLSEDDLFDALAPARRRYAVKHIVKHSDATVPTGDIADYVAEKEENNRQTCYISLIQTHLPMLDDIGVIDYDYDEQLVHTTDEFDALEWFVTKGEDATSSRSV